MNLESIPIQAFLIVSSVLFCIGIWGLLNSRNAVRVLMSIELMLNAVNINLMAFSSYIDNNLIQGQVFAIFVITVAAAEAAVGLAILLSLYRNRVTVDMETPVEYLDDVQLQELIERMCLVSLLLHTSQTSFA